MGPGARYARPGRQWIFDRALLRVLLASRRNGTLYVGVTNDLISRVYAHRNDLISGFTKQYRVHNLVYFEIFDDVREAIAREKRLKRWHRAWKIELIEKENKDWRDLWPELAQGGAR